MSDVVKHRVVFKELKKYRNSILCIQETHCDKALDELWSIQWGNTSLFSAFSSNLVGVAILFSRDMKPTIIWEKCDPNSRYIIVKVEVQRKQFIAANVYMPTSNNEQAQVDLLSQIEILYYFMRGLQCFF